MSASNVFSGISSSSHTQYSKDETSAANIANLQHVGLLPKSLKPERRTHSHKAPSQQPQRAPPSSTSVHSVRSEPTFPQGGSNDQYPSFSATLIPTRELSTKVKTGPKRHLGYAQVNHQWQLPVASNGAQTSFNWRSGRPMAGMLELERSRTRRERTFIGSECAVCEEPLEHTLRGERVLQFSCGHVSHEACFYEYIKEIDSQYCPTCNAPLGLDTSRGGNILDLEKLSSIIRSVASNNDQGSTHQGRSAQNTPTPWDGQTVRERPRSGESNPRQQRDSKDSREYPQQHQPNVRDYPSSRDSKSSSQRDRIERYTSRTVSSRPHARQPSSGAGSTDYDDVRRHDYDLQAMEASLSSPRSQQPKRPIPSPIVTVRSEYPSLTRSKHSQPLTCIITVEVPGAKWSPDVEDLRLPPVPNGHSEKEVVSPKLPSVKEHQEFAIYDTESPEELEEVAEDLRARVENWHGLDFHRFGKLKLFGTLRVSRDQSSWQELECFLFAEMLICVKEKRGAVPIYAEGNSKRKLTKCTLRGSILIKKHFKAVEASSDEPILSLSLAVQELPRFNLQLQNNIQKEQWKRAFLNLNAPQATQPPPPPPPEPEQDTSGTDEDEFRSPNKYRVSSMASSWGAGRSVTTGITDYSSQIDRASMPTVVHVPLDLVVVIPVSSSMQGLKINLLRDALRFMVQSLGSRDRMGLVTFGSSGGGVPLVGMTSKTWSGWNKVLEAIRPVGQKSLRADVVEGANVAMDLLMQRRSSNPIASILLISDSSTSDGDSVDFVVSRAEAAKVAIHSFGLGLTHKPDTLIELSSRTKASYTYVKDWMMLRECVAGCLGSLQTTSHQNAKLKLRLPEGSPAKFAKIQGALQITKRTGGREAEACLGDLRFGDKRDILVQLIIQPETPAEESLPQDHWESIVSGLEALGGTYETEDGRTLSVEEVPLIQADLSYGDLLRDGTLAHLPRPSLLAITMLPGGSRSPKNSRPGTPPIPPHSGIVQRRMELLTSDMLQRALYLVSRGQHDRAQHLLTETRTILKGLAKGGLPPLPPTISSQGVGSIASPVLSATDKSPERTVSPPLPSGTPFQVAPGIDADTLTALDSELELALEWINHPAVFGRDSRKAVLQAIGVISSQRGYSFRTLSESLWAGRIGGIKALTEKSRERGEVAEEPLAEESS